MHVAFIFAIPPPKNCWSLLHDFGSVRFHLSKRSAVPGGLAARYSGHQPSNSPPPNSTDFRAGLDLQPIFKV
jgi:hypothetical protein